MDRTPDRGAPLGNGLDRFGDHEQGRTMGLHDWAQTWLLWNSGSVRNAEQSLDRLRHREDVILPAQRRTMRYVPMAEARPRR